MCVIKCLRRLHFVQMIINQSEIRKKQKMTAQLALFQMMTHVLLKTFISCAICISIRISITISALSVQLANLKVKTLVTTDLVNFVHQILVARIDCMRGV